MSVVVANGLPRSLRRERAEVARPVARVWLNWGWLPLLAALGLSLMGVAAIGTTEPELAPKQLAFLGVGLLAAAVVGAQHWRWMQRAAWVLFVLNALLLVFILVPGVPESIVRTRNGARRWINLGVTDIQPSELIKLTWILAMASWLRVTPFVRRFGGVVMTFVVTAVPVALIVLQPDLDSAVLFVPTLMVMLAAAGARMRHLVAVVVIAVVLAPACYPFLYPHQKDRIVALVKQVSGDERVDQGIGYQSSRAKTLAGAGGLAGVGREEAGTLIRYNKLPEAHNDMIFAVIVCRWGFLGGVALWLMGAVYAFGCFMIALRSGTMFGRLVAVGAGMFVFVQLAVNTAMTIGLLPVTGMTLPFVSYGGSSLISLWITTGVLFAVASRRGRGFEGAEAAGSSSTSRSDAEG